MWDLKYIKNKKLTINNFINNFSIIVTEEKEFIENYNSDYPDNSISYKDYTTFHFYYESDHYKCIFHNNNIYFTEENTIKSLKFNISCNISFKGKEVYINNMNKTKNISGKLYIKLIHSILYAFNYKKITLSDLSFITIDNYYIPLYLARKIAGLNGYYEDMGYIPNFTYDNYDIIKNKVGDDFKCIYDIKLEKIFKRFFNRDPTILVKEIYDLCGKIEDQYPHLCFIRSSNNPKFTYIL